jgi:hypothetical protein
LSPALVLHLIVVPSGALTSLPFHLLVTEQPAAAVPDALTGYRDAAWLVKRQAVSVLPSVASLKVLRGFAHKDEGGKPLIGFGDPVFDANEGKIAGNQSGKAAQKVASRGDAGGAGAAGNGVVAMKASVTRGYAGFWQGGSIDRAQISQLPRLAETADELKAVAERLGASLDDIHLRADASESMVKHLPLSDYKIVYFATHGLVAGDVQGLAEPSLVLSLPAKPSAVDDGLLTASEVAQLKLNADWVVLSAWLLVLDQGLHRPDQRGIELVRQREVEQLAGLLLIDFVLNAIDSVDIESQSERGNLLRQDIGGQWDRLPVEPVPRQREDVAFAVAGQEEHQCLCVAEQLLSIDRRPRRCRRHQHRRRRRGSPPSAPPCRSGCLRSCPRSRRIPGRRSRSTATAGRDR